MAIQDSAHVDATDFLRKAEGTNEVRDQSTYSMCQLAQAPPRYGLPALVAVGRQTTIRSLVCRIEDHIGARLPTNHICVWSQMTSLLSCGSIQKALWATAYIESPHQHMLARRAPVLIKSPSPDICGLRDEILRPPDCAPSAFLLA